MRIIVVVLLSLVVASRGMNEVNCAGSEAKPGVMTTVAGTGKAGYAGDGGPASGALLFVAAKALKYWAIWSLGERWSFKVYVQPGRPLVDTGPYRYVAHPNYIGVVGELAGTAMMVGARWSGPLALVAIGLLLRARIRFEERALATYGGLASSAAPPRG